ncbi:MAG: hypothetical protein ACYDCC_11270 [Actinomycetota bacterium]
MIWIGALVAIATGVVYNGAAALQKREAMMVSVGSKHLLATLAHRKVWLAATSMSLVAWIGQVASLALAPVALVVPLLTIGSALLVVLGVRMLHERFHVPELIGIALVAIGAAIAGGSEAGSTASHTPLSFPVQLMIAAIACIGAVLIMQRKSGIAFGVASGFGFAAVAIFSKELGDRFAERGIHAVPSLLQSPAPYLLIAISIGALSLLQSGFQRANAASVMAALAMPEAIGPLIAGFALYHERYPHGVGAILLPLGLGCAISGSFLLARHGRALGAPT